MKFVLVPILIILLFTQTFSKWLVVMEYSMNRAFIAKNLCVNKAKPKMHCKGKCQMMKQMAEEEKQNSSNNTNNVRIKIQDLVFSDEMNKPAFPPAKLSLLTYNEAPPVFKYNAPEFSVFHPPAIG